MTTFNAVGAIITLDEYWNKCVHPKPPVPPSYPGASGNRHKAGHRQQGHRQAGHLRSYKDAQESDDEDEDEPAEVDESGKNSPDGCAESDFVSNVTQINYEMDDFNKTYCDASSPWEGESPNSQQWRLNVSRPQPNTSQKSNVKSRLDLGYKNRWQKNNKKPNWNRKNNGVNQHRGQQQPGFNHYRGQQQVGINHNRGQQQPGIDQNRGQQQHGIKHNRGQQQQQPPRFPSMEQRMRFAYNSFRDNANLEQPSANVLMNHEYNLQTIPQNPPEVQRKMAYSSSITSMVDSVSNLSNKHTYNQSYVRCEHRISSLNDGYVARGAQIDGYVARGAQVNSYCARGAQVNSYVARGAQVMNPLPVLSADATVQQVACHVMLMMTSITNDHQPTPEFFKNKKAINGAGQDCLVKNPRQGFK